MKLIIILKLDKICKKIIIEEKTSLIIKIKMLASSRYENAFSLVHILCIEVQ